MRFVTNGKTPKIEVACAKDETRPTLTKPYLTLDKPVKGKPRTGTISACDAYILAVIPVEFGEEEKPVEGHIEPKAFAEARKNEKRYGDKGLALLEDKTIVVGSAESYPPPTVIGQYPDVDKLMPDQESISHFQVGLNAAFLKRLADSLGTEGVVLEFIAGGPEATLPDGTSYLLPTNLRGIRVRPLGGAGHTRGVIDGPVGLMMPIRIAG